MRRLLSIPLCKFRNKILSPAPPCLGNVLLFKKIHQSSRLCMKLFKEVEINYAYSILERKGYCIPYTKRSIDQSLSEEQFERLVEKNWSQSLHKDLFQIFPILGNYSTEKGLCISNKIFDCYIDNLVDNIKYATDQELQNLLLALLHWPETDHINTRNYIEVWAALDDVCLDRMIKWSFDERLTFVTLFFMLNVTKSSEFPSKCLEKLASKAKQLTPKQLVQSLFFVSVIRKAPYDMHNLEVHLENNFSLFSVDELAIMSMGFFKSKTPIRNVYTVFKLIDKVIEHSKVIHEVSLAALLKIIRYSLKYTNNDCIYKLLDVLQHEVPRLSIMCNVHIALVASNSLTIHNKCLNNIAVNVIDHISETRLKDIERLVLCFGSLNIQPEMGYKFFESVISELRKPSRKPEIERYPRSLTSSLAYLGICGYFPVDLIDEVLDPTFLLKVFGRRYQAYGKEILTLHNTSELYLRDFNINSLNEKAVRFLSKKYTQYMPDENYQKQFNVTEKMILEIIQILNEIRGGNDYVLGDHILTHHSLGDLILCNTQDGVPVPVVKAFSNEDFGLVRRPPDKNLWIALVIAGRNVMSYNSNLPSGPLVAKIRELRFLGYYAELVKWDYYSTLITKEEKTEYLNSIITSALTKKNKYEQEVHIYGDKELKERYKSKQ